MTSPVTYTVEGGIALVRIDNPPVNAASHAVRQGLVDAITQADSDSDVAATLIYGAGRTFVAGADIREFGKPHQPPRLPDLITRIEASPKPVICALHGTALGGGLELALGCHYRVALKGARIGLPEVNIGLIPGAGGTQRMPRLVGVEKAIDIITSARQVPAEEALEIGAIDAISEEADPKAAGLAFARTILAEKRPVRRTSELGDTIASDADNAALFGSIRQAVTRKARGQTSPLRAVDAVEEGLKLPFDEAMTLEWNIFRECQASTQSKSLIHAFFSERAVSKVPGLEGVEPRPVNSVGVIGGGTMGAGITIALMTAGLPVTMVERDTESLERGRANVERVLDGNVKRGRMSAEKKTSMMETLYRGSLDYADFADVDVIIEAAFEDMGVKKEIFGKLDRIVRDGAVLATNTSYLDINEIAAETGRPRDVLGLHFFSPANIMKLLEIVVAEKTAPDVVATGFALAKRLRKVGVRAGVCDGFIGNRILATYRRQADYMVADGASPYDIDAALREFGFPMGPYQVADLAGLDIGWATRKRLAPTRDPRERYVTIADRICENGWFGQKTGRGFYLYPDGARTGVPDPDVEAIIAEEREKAGITPRAFSHEDIVRRYMAAMINEAAKVVEEGIALRPLDVDMTLLFGYGFPRWRGGPMKYADMVGLDRVLDDIRTYAEEDAFAWQPAKLIVDLVGRGDNFESLNKAK